MRADRLGVAPEREELLVRAGFPEEESAEAVAGGGEQAVWAEAGGGDPVGRLTERLQGLPPWWRGP